LGSVSVAALTYVLAIQLECLHLRGCLSFKTLEKPSISAPGVQILQFLIVYGHALVSVMQHNEEW